MKIGSTWATADRKEFVITDVKIVDNLTWIYYTNTFSKQDYSCLSEAFTSRFTEKINQ